MNGYNMRVFTIFIILLSVIFFAGCKHKKSKWQGYNEAKLTYISSTNSAVILKLLVKKGQYVNKNAPLILLEEQPESDEFNKAKADVVAAMATKKETQISLDLAKINFERDSELLRKQAIEQSEFDSSRTNYLKAQAKDEKAEADLNASKAAMAKTQWNVNQKALLAPKDSLVFDTYYLEGELPQGGKAILALLAPEDVKVVFYASEVELGRLKLGQKVMIKCDGCDKQIPAVISFISTQAEYTPPVIYSDQTRSELVFRIEAAPHPKDCIQLHPGQPVVVYKSNIS